MKESDRIRKKRKILNVLLWAFLILALACMLAFTVTLIMIGMNASRLALLTALCLGFFAACLIFGALAFCLYRKTEGILTQELDAIEREDSENSFFVGEGTMATFKDEELRLHGKDKTIEIPYPETRYFSVCTRRAPKEKGEWSVLIEIPAHYLNKSKRAEKPVLIQTDGKERLYRRLKELGLELIGEEPKQGGNKKFRAEKKFTLPDVPKRRKAAALMILGGIMFLGGIPVMIFASSLFAHAGTLGSIVTVLGAYFVIRAGIAYAQANSRLSVYGEGIFYCDSKGADAAFLKWEEFSRVEKVVREDGSVLRVYCPYGNYDFPLIEGAYEEIVLRHPEKESRVER